MKPQTRCIQLGNAYWQEAFWLKAQILISATTNASPFFPMALWPPLKGVSIVAEGITLHKQLDEILKQDMLQENKMVGGK
jgi:hypothetical protein